MSNPTPKPVKAEPADEGLKVRTTGEFMLLDPISRVEFDPGVATSTELTAFVERRLKLGHLEKVK